MAEYSYPTTQTAMTETLWRVMARGFSPGVIDNGASPYRVVSVDDTANTILVGRDTTTNTNEAILNGFVHRMDTDVSLTIGTAAGTYTVGLVYDPAGLGTTAGPVKLAVWQEPADYTNGKQRLAIFDIVRSTSQALSQAPRYGKTVWTRPAIMVTDENDKPARPQDYVFGTECLVYGTGKRYRANGTSWTEIPAYDSRVDEASGAVVSNVLVKRGNDGGFLVPTAVNGAHPVPLDQFNNALAGYSKTSHTHSYSSLTGAVPYADVDGSTHAYNNTNTGSTWASVVAKNTGEFARYPSALKYKRDVTDWRPTVEDILAMNPVHYYGAQSGDEHIGIVADYHAGTSVDMLVQYGDDERTEVEGWHYFLMPVAQQVVLRDHERRIVELTEQAGERDREVAALRRELDELKRLVSRFNDDGK